MQKIKDLRNEIKNLEINYGSKKEIDLLKA